MKKLYDVEGLEIPQLYSSFYQDKHWLYEQAAEGHFIKYCYKEEPNPGCPVGTLNHCAVIFSGEGQVNPNTGEEVKKAVVLLPTEALEYGTDEQLAREIQGFLHEWLDVTPLYEKLATYYIMITWLYDQLHTIPYLRAFGDTGVGKTRFLDAIGGLCYKATYINGAITPAPVFRLQEKWKGTLIMDEGDLKDTDAANEIMKMLNCGFERGKPVIRCDKEHPNQIETHDVYGPKVISTRQTFQDKALEARCITEIMRETSRDISPSLTREFFEKRQELRNKLLLFRFRNLVPLQERLKSKMPQTGLEKLHIEPRLKQVGTPFAIIFYDKPAILKEFFDWIQENQSALIEERATTLEGEIVEIIYENQQNLESQDDYLDLTTGVITDKLNEGRNKPLNPRIVGRIVKQLGLQTKLTKEEGKTKRRIKNDKKLLQKLYERYVPSLKPVTSVTTVTTILSSPSTSLSLSGKGEKGSLHDTSVTIVTDVTKKEGEIDVEDLGVL